MDEAAFNMTFLPDEADTALMILHHITGMGNSSNMKNIAHDLQLDLGVIRVVINRAHAAGLVHHMGPPLVYFVL